MNKSEKIRLQENDLPGIDVVRERLRRCEEELSKILIEFLAVSPTATDVDLSMFDQTTPTPGRPTDERSFAWAMAAISLEDKAIQVAEGWLDDTELDPERLERVVDLLSDVPGYWAMRGLDGDLLEQVARRLHDPAPRPISQQLRFVAGVLALVESQEDREKVLVS